MKAEDKLLEIIYHYGTRHQLRKLNEETFELIEAVMNFESGNKLGYTQEEITEYRKAIVEEIADVTVLLEQIRLYYLIPEKEVIRIKWEKVERQLGRIANEKN